MAVYALVFSAVTGCFAFICNVPFLVLICAAVFGILNITAGFFGGKTNNARLRTLRHGTTLLVSFIVSVASGMAVHSLMLAGIIDVDKTALIYSLIFCTVCNFLMFWNGIISAYLTSVQLGIKIRVIGLVCGMIPILNLAALSVIIRKTYSEFVFETKKEQINLQRQNDRICATKYPILLVHGVFFRDNKLLNYWGRIPKELEQNGTVCHYGNEQMIDENHHKCLECEVEFKISEWLKLDEYSIPMIHGKKIFGIQLGEADLDKALEPIMVVVTNPQDPSVVGLKNCSYLNVILTTKSGKEKTLAFNEVAPMKAISCIKINSENYEMIHTAS